MSESRARAALGGGHKKPGAKTHKGKVHSVHVRRAAGGGFIARNEREQDPNDPQGQGGPEEYALSDSGQLAQHMDEHMGDQPAVAAPAQAAPAQPAPQMQ